MNQELLKKIVSQVSFEDLLIVILAILAAWITTLFLRLASRSLSNRFSRLRIVIQQSFLLFRVVIWGFAALFSVFQLLKHSTNILFGVAASLGLAIGLASQDLLKNFLSWLIVVITRPISLGDMVQAENDYGEVTAITPNLIKLRTFNDNQVTFPTFWLLSKKISNSNTGSLQEMVVVDIRLPAHLDTQKLCQIAWSAAANSPYTCLSRPIAVNITDEFNRTFLTKLTLKCYVLDVRLERIQKSHLTQLIKTELNKTGLLSPALVAGLILSDQKAAVAPS